MALRRTRIGGSFTRRRQTLKTAWKHNSTTSAVYQKRQTLKYSWNKLPLDRLTFSLVSGRALCLFLSMVPIVYPVLHALIFLTFHRFDRHSHATSSKGIFQSNRDRDRSILEKMSEATFDEDSLSFMVHTVINGPRYDQHSRCLSFVHRFGVHVFIISFRWSRILV